MDFFKLNQELFVVNVLLNTKVKFVCTLVSKIGDKIKVVKETVVLDSIDALKKVIVDQPVIVLFNGEKVLYTDKAELFSSTINLFYTTKYIASNQQEFLALARQEEVDAIVAKFLDKGIHLIDLYVGGFSVAHFYKKNFTTDEFRTNYCTLWFDDQDCIKVEKHSDAFHENDVANENTLALSCVFDHYYFSDKLITNYVNPVFNDNKTESVHKSEFQFYGKIALLMIFFIMFLSFGMTKFFSAQNKTMESKLNYVIQEEVLLNELKKDKSKREEILRISGFLNSEGISYWTNTMMKNIPESMVLSEFEVFPLKEKLKKNKKAIINGNLISVKGSSFDENSFNNWVKLLTTTNEIFKIDIAKYAQKKDGEANFELKVQLRR